VWLAPTRLCANLECGEILQQMYTIDECSCDGINNRRGDVLLQACGAYAFSATTMVLSFVCTLCAWLFQFVAYENHKLKMPCVLLWGAAGIFSLMAMMGFREETHTDASYGVGYMANNIFFVVDLLYAGVFHFHFFTSKDEAAHYAALAGNQII